ncbi:MAG TPA: hypothetical protein VFB30_14165, partial [Spirochaetia bacterium]|nr:hypothetical protein [Spirochaetia bacterium]
MPSLDARRAQAVLLEHLDNLRFKPSTVRTRFAYLKPFFQFAEQAGIHDLREVNAAEIQRYLQGQA